MRKVTIHSMKINTYGIGCTVSFGPSLQKGICSTGKKNQGFGEESSDGSQFHCPKQCVDDRDVEDSWQDLGNL